MEENKNEEILTNPNAGERGVNGKLHEERKSSSFWYWLIFILLIILVGWYGYSAGWFNSSKDRKVEMGQNQKTTERRNPFSDENLAPITEVQLKTSTGFPVEKTLIVKGTLPDSCSFINDPQVVRDGNTFYVNVTMRKEGENCAEIVKEYELPIDLQVLGLPAGVYTLIINGKETSFELEQDNKIEISPEEEK